MLYYYVQEALIQFPLETSLKKQYSACKCFPIPFLTFVNALELPLGDTTFVIMVQISEAYLQGYSRIERIQEKNIYLKSKFLFNRIVQLPYTLPQKE